MQWNEECGEMGRRRRVEEEHENHERWLVSYADFITLLFAFFVVMYSLSSVNEGKYRVLSDSMVQAFRSISVNAEGNQLIVPPVTPVTPPKLAAPPKPVQDAAAAAERQALSARMRSMADDIKRVLEPLSRGGQVRVTEGAHGITVEINASVLFQVGEATLDAQASRALGAVAEVLAGADFPITIEGHTDNIPINTYRFPSNWELSAVRASSVVRLFVDSGVAPGRLTAAGYADQRPLGDNNTEEGRARNRRVTLLIESMLGAQGPEGTTSAVTSTTAASILPPRGIVPVEPTAPQR